MQNTLAILWGKAETDWEEVLMTSKTGLSMSVYGIFYRYEGPDACEKPAYPVVRCRGMVVITKLIRTNPDAFMTHGNSTKVSQTSIPIINKTLKKIRWAKKNKLSTGKLMKITQPKSMKLLWSDFEKN